MAAALGRSRADARTRSGGGGLEKGEVKAISRAPRKPALAGLERAHARATRHRAASAVGAHRRAGRDTCPPCWWLAIRVLPTPSPRPSSTRSRPISNASAPIRRPPASSWHGRSRPDVAVVDADLPGAPELVEKLCRDPLTEPMPLMVVGTWSTPEDGANGSPRARRARWPNRSRRTSCGRRVLQLSNGSAQPMPHIPLGQTTVEELTARIIDEVKRGLPEALGARKSDLHCSSAMAATSWRRCGAAVARVRDLVMIKSNGAVRFSGEGPEGALPFAPWWGDSPTAAQRGPRGEPTGRRALAARGPQSRGGRRRSRGDLVRRRCAARGGSQGSRSARRRSGARAVLSVQSGSGHQRRAHAGARRLRSVPRAQARHRASRRSGHLLSWKEDLLQRLRDLGADADGYLRKEASAAAILQRVDEVLRTRARIESRLKGDGEVRGRLDGVTPRTLLDTISQLRPDARLCIRDASFLYEIEMRGGAPKSATRTTSDGSFQRGREVFAALLGVRAGRFVASKAQGPARGTLEGDLDSQMEAPVAHARAALRLLGGTRLLELHRVNVAVDRVLAYMAATPEPARSLITRLANGASPRGLILGSEVAPAQLEEVLCDLATHGAIVGVHGAGDTDLLGPALEQELSAIRRGGTPSNRPPEDVKVVVVNRGGEKPKAIEPPRTESPEPPKSARMEPPKPPKPVPVKLALQNARWFAAHRRAAHAISASGSLLHRPRRPRRCPACLDPCLRETTLRRPPVCWAKCAWVRAWAWDRCWALASRKQSRPTSGPDIKVEPSSQPGMWPGDDEEGHDQTPSSLEAAVIREISDRTPLPGPPPVPTDGISTIVNARELKTRALAATVASDPPRAAIPSLPPDAVVPASSSEDRIKTSELASTGVMEAIPCGRTVGGRGDPASTSSSCAQDGMARLDLAARRRARSRSARPWLGISIATCPRLGTSDRPSRLLRPRLRPPRSRSRSPTPLSSLAAPLLRRRRLSRSSVAVPTTETAAIASADLVIEGDGASAGPPSSGERFAAPHRRGDHARPGPSRHRDRRTRRRSSSTGWSSDVDLSCG